MKSDSTTNYTDIQILDIATWRQLGLEWAEVSDKYNEKYQASLTSEAIRHIYRRFGHLTCTDSAEASLQLLKDSNRTRKNSAKIQKRNRTILEALELQEDIVDSIQTVVEQLNRRSPKKIVKPKKHRRRKSMTLELLLSDVHFGKQTETFNLAICRSRLQYLTTIVVREFYDESKIFNVERIIIALMGDMIESATMHGLESAKGCEFGNSRQVQECIISVFEDVIEPLAQLGVPIDLPCVTGNHDRTEEKRTYHNPGEENLTYIIYKSLQYLCKQAGYKHIKFDIPIGPYTTLQIYGNVALYEHFDNAKANTRVALETLMMKRQKQTKQVISFMRGGHFHESTMYGQGTICVNGSVPGQDSFADVLGFDSAASQTLNYYVETLNRPSCFYRSFPVYLGGD